MSRNTIAIVKSGVCLSFSWKDIKIPSVFSFRLWQEEVDIYKSTKKKNGSIITLNSQPEKYA